MGCGLLHIGFSNPLGRVKPAAKMDAGRIAFWVLLPELISRGR